MSARSSGISFGGVLLGILIALKLTGVIAWSWWWVLAPLWISFGLGVFAVAVAVLVLAIRDARDLTPKRPRHR